MVFSQFFLICFILLTNFNPKCTYFYREFGYDFECVAIEHSDFWIIYNGIHVHLKDVMLQCKIPRFFYR